MRYATKVKVIYNDGTHYTVKGKDDRDTLFKALSLSRIPSVVMVQVFESDGTVESIPTNNLKTYLRKASYDKQYNPQSITDTTIRKLLDNVNEVNSLYNLLKGLS